MSTIYYQFQNFVKRFTFPLEKKYIMLIKPWNSLILSFIELWETNFTEMTLLFPDSVFWGVELKVIRKRYSREFWQKKKLYDLWKLGFMRPCIIRINGGLVLLYFPSSSGLEWKEWIHEIVWPWQGEDACSKGASAGSKINGSLLFQETWRSICGWSYLTR